MTELAEQLTAWREIATLSFSGSKRTFIANLFAKGKFLLGVTKIILSFKTAQGLVRHYAYGFPEQTDYEAYIQAKKNADNVIYRTVTKHGYSGQFLIEIDHKPSPGEEPLLTAITQRICEAISFWQLEEALLSAYRKQEENVSLLNSLNDSDCANVGIYLKNIAGVYKMVNSYWARLFAKEPAQMVGRTDFDLLPDKIGQIIAAAEQKTIQTGVAEHYLQKIQLGWQEIWLQMVNYPVYNQEQELIGIGGIAVDITDTKENELRLRYSSAYDILTGLYNRNYFEEQMEALAANEDNYPVSVICLDINDLKIVNDTWGHDKGDQLLKEIGMLVKHYFKAPAFLARVGGDEFAALLPKTDGEKAAALCKKIRHTIEQHNRQSSDIPINVSLGVATCDAPLTPLAKTFKEADNAMYLDKLRRTGNTKNILLSIFNKALAERDFSFVDHGERLSKLASGFGEYLGLSK
jgi:diguanylate cyclase (GGDEF)-like protein